MPVNSYERCDGCMSASGYDCTYAVEYKSNPLEVLHIAGCAECGPE